MDILRFALGVRFETYNDSVTEADKDAVLGELALAVPASLVRGMHVYGGVCPIGDESGEGIYTVVFINGPLGPMRRLYRTIDSDAALNAMLEPNEPFIQNNVIRNFSGMEFFGIVDKQGVCEGGSGRMPAFVRKPSGRRRADEMKTVLIAPNSFKGTIPAGTAARHISRALRRELPGVKLVPVPVADGGDGTLEAIRSAVRCTVRTAKVTGPYGEPVEAKYLVAGGSSAVIESALASGLALCSEAGLDPLKATSFGTGELIRRALHEGVREVSVCLGGSATNDCGMGLARALGYRFIKADGEEAESASELAEVAAIDENNADPLIKKAAFTAVCDVKNPLLGPNGATYTFGPQKGAGAEALELLENGMSNMARLLDAYAGRAVSQTAGAGSAGGMGAMLAALLNARIRSGAEELLRLSDFDEKLRSAAFVITGEGMIDGTSLDGKAVGEIIERVDKAAGGASRPAAAVIAGCGGEGAELVEAKCRFVEYCGREEEPLKAFDAAARRLAEDIASEIK